MSSPREIYDLISSVDAGERRGRSRRDIIRAMQDGKPHIMPPFVIYGMLALGLVSAFAFRVIIVLERVEPAWVRPAWYVGAGGYVFFFFYRYRISRKRKNTIRRNRLIEKVRSEECLRGEDRDLVLYLLNSIKSSREDINYAVIFLLSVIAIAADVGLWLIK
jgi:hypothetical protein